jgi:glycosyltransferase involved in cell wall biosynthesis
MEGRSDHLRICFVSLQFPPSVGGAQMQAERQAQQLRNLGHDVMIVTLRLKRQWARKTLLHGLPVVRVGGIYKPDGTLRIGRLGIWPASIGVFLVLWRQRYTYDVIHTFQVSVLAAAVVLIGKLTHKPIIIRIMAVGPTGQKNSQHEPRPLMADTLTDRSFLLIDSVKDQGAQDDIGDLLRNTLGGRKILNFIQKSDSYFQALSTRSICYLSSWGIPLKRIVYIHGNVDTEKFRPGQEKRPDPNRPERLVTCVARLEYQKGIDVLLLGWRRMISTSSEWRIPLMPKLRLIGDGALRPQFERMAAELNIRDSVEFLGLRSDILDLLQQSWGFVLPSRNEGMSNALLEAMACGLPCIATRVSGSEDIITDGLNGILVESEQPVQMADALRCLIEDTELAQRLGREARVTVVREYQLAQSVERCLALYYQLLAEN